MTEREALKLIAVMATALPREWSFLSADQQKATQALYVRMLADLDYAAANAAVEALLATATTMPKIADVRTATLRVIHGDVRPGGDAWGDVLKLYAYRNVGDTSGIDPDVLHVVTVMGWIEHRTLTRLGVDVEQWHVVTGENESADRARFIELYDKRATVRRREQNVSQLPAAQRYALTAEQTREAKRLPAGPARADFAALIPTGDPK